MKPRRLERAHLIITEGPPSRASQNDDFFVSKHQCICRTTVFVLKNSDDVSSSIRSEVIFPPARSSTVRERVVVREPSTFSAFQNTWTKISICVKVDWGHQRPISRYLVPLLRAPKPILFSIRSSCPDSSITRVVSMRSLVAPSERATSFSDFMTPSARLPSS